MHSIESALPGSLRAALGTIPGILTSIPSVIPRILTAFPGVFPSVLGPIAGIVPSVGAFILHILPGLFRLIAGLIGAFIPGRACLTATGLVRRGGVIVRGASTEHAAGQNDGSKRQSGFHNIKLLFS